MAGSGGAAGVLLGGILTEYVGWEWVLWVNVPIGIGAALLAPRLILESHAEHETRHFDFGVRPASRPVSRCSSTRWSKRRTRAGARARPSGSSDWRSP